MTKARTLQDMFRRYRRPGDLVYACLCLAFSLFLAVNLPSEVKWVPGMKLLAQPAFWPWAAVIAMVAFSALHLVSGLLSERLEGRWREVGFWLRAVEYAGWFMVYVVAVPLFGYLPATILFTVLLTYRLGYRGWRSFGAAALFGFAVVVVFKGFLQVKVPGGAAYEVLPPALRSIMLTYF